MAACGCFAISRAKFTGHDFAATLY